MRTKLYLILSTLDVGLVRATTPLIRGCTLSHCPCTLSATVRVTWKHPSEKTTSLPGHSLLGPPVLLRPSSISSAVHKSLLALVQAWHPISILFHNLLDLSVIRLPLSNPRLLNNPPLTTGQVFLQAPRLWRAASTLFVIPVPFPLLLSREGILAACSNMSSSDFSGLCALACFCSLCFSFLFAVLGMEARPCLC